jgi:Ca2+-dependent lipid-binding protein
MEALGGTLIIEVIEGKLERDTEAFGKMDCYVEIKYRD